MSNSSQLVNQLRQTAGSFESSVNEQSQKVHVALQKIDTTVNHVNQQISDLREYIIKGEEKQIAHENVLRIDQQIDEQLKSYQIVRRSVLGVIKDFDINLARNSTIQQLSEELWMSTSRYWLSYAFIAISAWVQDNKEICRNAVTEAIRRDATKSSLFFCLLNLRFGRNVQAREWLYEYFGAVDSLHPPRETALLLQAYLYGIFGKDSQLDNFVQSTVEKWVTQLNTDPEIATSLVGDYSNYLKTLPTEKTEFSTNALREHCSNLNEIYASMDNAGRYAAALKRIDKLDSVEEYRCGNDFIAGIDRLLNDLVTNYEDEELRLRKEQEFYHLVMQHEGDVEAAKKQYNVYLDTVKDAPNIGKQMFSWAAYATGVDESVQKFALQKTKCWYQDALNQYDHDIKAAAPQSFALEVDLWKESTDGKDREAVKKSLNDKFKAEKSKLLIFIKPNIVMTALAVALLIIGCVIGVAANVWWGYVAGGGLFAVFALIVVLTTLIRLKTYPARIKRAEDTLSACLDEIDGFRAAFEKASAIKDDIAKKLEYI